MLKPEDVNAVLVEDLEIDDRKIRVTFRAHGYRCSLGFDITGGSPKSTNSYVFYAQNDGYVRHEWRMFVSRSTIYNSLSQGLCELLRREKADKSEYYDLSKHVTWCRWQCSDFLPAEKMDECLMRLFQQYDEYISQKLAEKSVQI